MPSSVRHLEADVKPSLALLAIAAAVAGCASGATTQPAAPMSARVVLPSRTMLAGSQMSGHVVVDNNTGHAIHTHGCGSPFAVALATSIYHPQVITGACSGATTIPAGRFSYPVKVLASYLACSIGHPDGDLPPCLPGRKLPPLPAGTYQATLFQDSHVVPAPPTIPVRVTRVYLMNG